MSDEQLIGSEPAADGSDGSVGTTPGMVTVRRRRVAPWVALVAAVVLAGFFVILIGADVDNGRTAGRSRLLGNPAPEAIGTLDDGRAFDLSRRKGSWVMVNFFQSECRPCIIEHPALVEFVEKQPALGAAGVEFYSVVVGDSREDVEAFFEERGGDWPIVMTHEQIDVAFGVAQVPETWIIDPSGVVVAQFPGSITAEQLDVTMQQLREAYG